MTGTGTAIHRAERGILILQASSNPVATTEQASAIITATAKKLREAIAPYCPQDEETGRTKEGAAIAHYSMSTMNTSCHNDYARRRNEPETSKSEPTYSAKAEFNIKFSDFAVLDKLTTQFSAMENVRIDRIDWRLTDATLHSIEGGARKGAARDAIQKARDYAEVFAGISAEEAKTRVKAVEVKESRMYQQITRPQLHYGKAQRVRETVLDTTELQFEPEDVRLDVSIDGTFRVDM